jgi:hypothetical protein
MTNPTPYPVIASGGFHYWQTTGGQCRAVYVNGVQYVATDYRHLANDDRPYEPNDAEWLEEMTR